MAQLDNRAELISSAILAKAKQEAQDIIEKANLERDTELKTLESEIVEGMYSKMQAKAIAVRVASQKSIAKYELQKHRTLMTHRSEITDKVMAAVAKALADYSATEDYKKALLTKAEQLKTDFVGDDCVILVSETQQAIAEEINKILGGKAKIQQDPNIHIGGFKLKNLKTHRLVDETLDEKLHEEKQWFYNNCGLQITSER